MGYALISLVFTKQAQILTALRKKPFENIVGKGENDAFSDALSPLFSHSKAYYVFFIVR